MNEDRNGLAELDQDILTFDVPDDALERAAPVSDGQAAHTIGYCTQPRLPKAVIVPAGAPSSLSGPHRKQMRKFARENGIVTPAFIENVSGRRHNGLPDAPTIILGEDVQYHDPVLGAPGTQ